MKVIFTSFRAFAEPVVNDMVTGLSMISVDPAIDPLDAPESIL